MNSYDVIVVGAGFGGLSAASLLTKRGFNVLVLEASNELGGCAGKFERANYRFAAGATLGMGFETDGVIAKLYKELSLSLPTMTNIPIIMDVHLPDGNVRYWREKANWYQEIQNLFPRESSRMIEFFEEVFYVGSLLDNIIDKKIVFPPNRFSHIKSLVPLINKQNLNLVPFLTQSVFDRLKRYELLANKKFLHFINGQLMDSVQTTAEYTPAFLGYAALQTFHKGAFYLDGGLATIAYDLAQYIEKQGGMIKKLSKVQNVNKYDNQWIVNTKKDTFTAKNVIFNNSLHNLHDLLSEDIKTSLKVKEDQEKKRQSWGAFTIYVGCNEHFLEKDEPLFHQFITDYNKPLSEGNHILLSLSSSNDYKMAPKGKRSATISTHTKLDQWWNMEHYDSLKNLYTDNILQSISQNFPKFQQSIEILLPATPVTFKRFVHRDQGKVGGYIPSGKFSWLKSFSTFSGIEGIWFCGDTVFPGAGTLGTVLSGMTVADQLST